MDDDEAGSPSNADDDTESLLMPIIIIFVALIVVCLTAVIAYMLGSVKSTRESAPATQAPEPNASSAPAIATSEITLVTDDAKTLTLAGCLEA